MGNPKLINDALRTFVVVISFCFGDVMNRVLLLRVARLPLPKLILPPGLFILASFGLCAEHNQMIEDYLGSHCSWWYFITFIAILNHLSFFSSSVKGLAKVL